MREIGARTVIGTEFACEVAGRSVSDHVPRPTPFFFLFAHTIAEVLDALALVTIAVGLPLRSPDR